MSRFAWLLFSLVVGVSLFALGCASPQVTVTSTDALDSAPLKPGDSIRVEFYAVDAVPEVYQIDAHGSISFPAQAVEVAGLTPAEAASKIRQIYVPRYFHELDVRVTKVQPNGLSQ